MIEVLWIDDECMTDSGKRSPMGEEFVNYAYEQKIKITPMQTYKEGVGAIRNNPHKWCAVILDIHNQKATSGKASDDFDAARDEIKSIQALNHQKEPYIFILSGNKLYHGEHSTIRKPDYCSKSIYDKNGEEEDKLIVALVRGDLEVEESKLSNAVKANSLRPARPEEIEAHGMVPGFASPIGATGEIITVVDDTVAESNNLVAGANETGYHYLNTNYGRDYTGIVADIASAREGALCPHCGKPLKASKGVEIGNIFQLGTRYSESMNATYQDEEGKQIPVVMGSYGIGVGRLLACLAEEYNDEGGLKLPMSVSPYQVHLVSLVKDTAVAESIYEELTKAGIEVLYDDRKETAGVKFADADLIGVPIRITLGNRSLKDGKVEVKLRSTGEETSYDISDIAEEIKAEIAREMAEIDANIVEKDLE